MRKFLLSIILICVLVLPASAHPGRTDGSGGHYDHSTGEYHYHHGYPPHDHEDLDGDGDLDCPYKFKDKTGESSGESSGSVTRYPTPTRPPTPPAAPEYTRPVSPSGNSEPLGEGPLWKSILALTAAPLVILAFICIFSAAEREPASRSKPYHGPPVWEGRPDRVPIKAAQLPEPPKPLILDDRGRLEQLVRKYGRPNYEGLKFPPELRLSEDGQLYWGDRTVNRPHGDGTVYITSSGRCWHLNRGCRGADQPVLIYRAMFKHQPCRLCVPKDACPPRIPIWYHHFVELRTREYRRNRG